MIGTDPASYYIVHTRPVDLGVSFAIARNNLVYIHTPRVGSKDPRHGGARYFKLVPLTGQYEALQGRRTIAEQGRYRHSLWQAPAGRTGRFIAGPHGRAIRQPSPRVTP